MDSSFIDLEKERYEIYKKYKSLKITGYFTLIFLIGIIFLIEASSIKSNFLKNFKKKCVEATLNETYDTVSYNELAHISDSVILESGLFNYPMLSIQGEDLVKGKYKDVDFLCSDIEASRLIKRIDSHGNEIYTPIRVFKGRWLSYYSKNNTYPTILIKEAKNEATMETEGLVPIEVESILFNEKFQVYAESAEEAFKILTPKMIEKILSLEGLYRGQLLLSFKGNNLQVGINDSVDYFEVDFSKPINEDTLNGLYAQIDIFAAIINEFNI